MQSFGRLRSDRPDPGSVGANSLGGGGAIAGRYPIPARIHRVEETIQRSRFVTTVAHAPDAAAAHAFIEETRAEFADATHNCWAFVAGAPGSTMHVGMSDDGEPHGTAGRPMLNALLHGGVGELVVVCTRYYGGVKLGTGGLSRAYSGGVVLALETLPRDEKVDRVEFIVTVGYPDVDALQRLIGECALVIVGETFGAEVRYRLGVPSDEADLVVELIQDLTRGSARIERAE